jgi:galactonate dehydratase
MFVTALRTESQTMIEDYTLFDVPPRWLFLRVETTDGIVGWGEPIVEGQRQAVKAAVRKLMDEYLVGSDPLRTEYHWQQMYRGGFYRGGPVLLSAIAGIDQALWDIKGKHFDEPVAHLLGGPVRDKIRLYHWLSGDQIIDPSAEATQSAENGFEAVKFNATGRLEHVDSVEKVSEAASTLSAVFEAVSDELDIILDFHGRASRAMAPRLLEAVEPYEPLFVEEPLRPEYDHHLQNLSPSTSIPLATGERLYSRWDCQDLIESGAIELIQPNVSHAGGITEVMKIAALAETHDVSLSPVCSVGPISFAASLQVDVAVQNFSIQEQTTLFQDTTSYGRIVSNTDDFEIEDGYCTLPDRPGLGIELDEDVVREIANDEATEWSTPTWEHDDGSLAEW